MLVNKYRLGNLVRRNKLKLQSIERIGVSVVIYHYSVTGFWKRLFEQNELKIDFGADISKVPDSVLVIPLLTNILPIVWLCNAVVYVGSLDKQFMNCIEGVKCGYSKMYPYFEFLGEICADVVESNEVKSCIHSAAMFYSAGVDSFSTFLNHKEESPLLITLCGSDIRLDDSGGWRAMKRRQKFMEERFNLECVSIFSNFRSVIHERRLTKLISLSGDNWWHGFQHGIAIIGHAAPLAYKYGIKTLYLASSFTPAVYGKITCASDPTIDNKVTFLQTKVYHDGDNRDRFQKIKQISEFHKETGIIFPLHVCWESGGGENCSTCEKCSRTILALYACGEDPVSYGFKPELVSEANVRKGCRTKYNYENSYRRTVEALNTNYTSENIAWWAKWARNFHVSDDKS